MLPLLVLELQVSKIFGPKRDEVSGLFKVSQNEGLYDLYRSPRIVKVVKCGV
jgi:hypothetical protein